MVLAVMVSLLASAPSGATPSALGSDDPPIKVWLNQDSYYLQGDKARTYVKLAEDGYLVVLRADAQGRVRILFPLDPTADAFARGGKKLEIRGRGDREAFYVDDREGRGVVLAARSVAPFKFDEFVRGDHWDYRVLSTREAGDDKEAALLELVQRMVPDGGGHFDYDVATYTVESQDSYSRYHRHYSSGLGWGWPYYGFRYRFAFNSCYDPLFYDPFFCGSTLFDPFFYDPFFYGYNPYLYRPFLYGGGVVVYNRPRVYGGGLFIDRAAGGVGYVGGGLVFKNRYSGAPTVMGVGPRLRVPQGTLLNRAGEGRAVPVSQPASAARPIRAREPWLDGARVPSRARREPEERRAPAAAPAPEARRPERRDAPRGWDRPRDSGGGGGGSRGGGGGSASAGRGSSGSSGGSRGSSGSAPSSGGGRRKP